VGYIVPKGTWSDIANQREYLDRIGKELGVKEVRVHEINYNNK